MHVSKDVLFGVGVIAGAGVVVYAGPRLITEITAWATNALTSPWEAWRTQQLCATNALGEAALAASLNLRRSAQSTPVDSAEVSAGHTHPSAAASRKSFRDFAARALAHAGRTQFAVQRSLAEQQAGISGDRQYHWAKDVMVRCSAAEPSETDVCVLTDVDFYIDMPRRLCTPRATIIYTVNPESAAAVLDDVAFTFNGNELEYRVTGGGVYRHRLWDWNIDNLHIVGRTFGLVTSCTTYLVDRRKISPHREAVILTPIGHWTGLAAWLAATLHGGELARLSPADGAFTRLRVHARGAMNVSTAVAGEFVSVTTDEVADAALRGAAATGALRITAPTVTSYLDGPYAREHAQILLQYYRAAVTRPPVAYTVPVEHAVTRYQFEPRIYNPLAKPSMTAFMRPLVNAAYAPDRCAANDRECIKERVTKPASDKVATRRLARFFREFAERVIPVPGSFHPVGVDEVHEKQARPTQRHLIDVAAMAGRFYSAVNKFFTKAEAYQKPGPPRPIVIKDPQTKLDYSRYMYALSDGIKAAAWYAFSRTPRQIAMRVTEVLANARTATNTDFSKFDGHIGPALREFERVVALRAFAPQYHAELVDLLGAQMGGQTYGLHGEHFTSEYSRQSGSPETSIFNSLDNALVAYITLRSGGHTSGNKLSPDEAYAALGVYGGDDGLTADVNPEFYSSVATSLGLTLEVEPVIRGNVGITFLSRLYGPNVWTGDASSMCDLRRALSKLHVTHSLADSVHPLRKLKEKFTSLALSDWNTPVIGPVVQRFFELAGMERDNIDALSDPLRLRSYLTKCAVSEQYPNDVQDFAESLVTINLPELEPQALSQLANSLVNLRSFLTMNVVATLRPVAPKSSAVVGEEVVNVDVAASKPANLPGKKPGGKPASRPKSAKATSRAGGAAARRN